MQAIVKLTLERPFQLRISQVSRMEFEIIGVNRHRRILEGDDDLDRVVLQARVEREQRVFIKTQMCTDAFEILLWSGVEQSSLRDSQFTRH